LTLWDTFKHEKFPKNGLFTQIWHFLEQILTENLKNLHTYEEKNLDKFSEFYDIILKLWILWIYII